MECPAGWPWVVLVLVFKSYCSISELKTFLYRRSINRDESTVYIGVHRCIPRIPAVRCVSEVSLRSYPSTCHSMFTMRHLPLVDHVVVE